MADREQMESRIGASRLGGFRVSVVASHGVDYRRVANHSVGNSSRKGKLSDEDPLKVILLMKRMRTRLPRPQTKV